MRVHRYLVNETFEYFLILNNVRFDGIKLMQANRESFSKTNEMFVTILRKIKLLLLK